MINMYEYINKFIGDFLIVDLLTKYKYYYNDEHTLDNFTNIATAKKCAKNERIYNER